MKKLYTKGKGLVRPFTSIFFFSIMLGLAFKTAAQVKIGNNPATINANSLLELESTNKGFLPPRVALNSLTSVSPLTGTVPAGMLVFSAGGTLPDGYYYWNGSTWHSMSREQMVTKTTSVTLGKTETFVLASNDIVLTLPTVTTADNGLAITVKNTGSYTDLVRVKGNGTTIDGKDSANLTRWIGRTFVAHNGAWIARGFENATENVLDVSPRGSWVSFEEALAFLDEHMTGPAIIRLSGDLEISSTQIIDLPYPLTIEGLAYGKATLSAGSGLSGSPMFRCLSETYFKMLAFDGSALSGAAGEDAIQLEGSGEYYEIKDCNFDGFYRGVVSETNVETWVFEVDFNNMTGAGIEVAAGSTNGATLKVSEVDFINCAKGINLLSGNEATVSILNSTFYNSSGGVGLNYVPATFTNFSSLFCTNNAWNNVGSFLGGFDFSRPDGRDSKAFIQNNAGDPSRNPNCHINVVNSAVGGTLNTANIWYRATWNHAVTTVATTSWLVANSASGVNKLTYLPVNKRSGYFIISGNLICNNSNRTISVGVFKNGNNSLRLGETTIRVGSSNQPTLFTVMVYIADIAQNDFFELGLSSNNSNDFITIQDLQWLAETK